MKEYRCANSSSLQAQLSPAEECSTISDSDVPSVWISELFSDTLSWTGKWTDSDEEQMCDLEEDEVPSTSAASIKIELSAIAAPSVCIAKSFEEDSWSR